MQAVRHWYWGGVKAIGPGHSIAKILKEIYRNKPTGRHMYQAWQVLGVIPSLLAIITCVSHYGKVRALEVLRECYNMLGDCANTSCAYVLMTVCWNSCPPPISDHRFMKNNMENLLFIIFIIFWSCAHVGAQNSGYTAEKHRHDLLYVPKGLRILLSQCCDLGTPDRQLGPEPRCRLECC